MKLLNVVLLVTLAFSPALPAEDIIDCGTTNPNTEVMPAGTIIPLYTYGPGEEGQAQIQFEFLLANPAAVSQVLGSALKNFMDSNYFADATCKFCNFLDQCVKSVGSDGGQYQLTLLYQQAWIDTGTAFSAISVKIEAPVNLTMVCKSCFDTGFLE